MRKEMCWAVDAGMRFTGVLMIFVVLLSKKLGVNPDNVATPVAASLGDLTTLALLAAVGKVVFMVVQGELDCL